MAFEFDEPDNGTAEWAEEQAAGLIAVAHYRHMQNDNKKAAAAMLDITSFARSLITPEQWKILGGVTD